MPVAVSMPSEMKVKRWSASLSQNQSFDAPAQSASRAWLASSAARACWISVMSAWMPTMPPSLVRRSEMRRMRPPVSRKITPEAPRCCASRCSIQTSGSTPLGTTTSPLWIARRSTSSNEMPGS